VTDAPQPDPSIGQLVIATRVITGGPASARSRSVLVLLAVSVGLMMIGYGIAMPVFANRLAEFGSGVAALGFMTMGFAAAGVHRGRGGKPDRRIRARPGLSAGWPRAAE
jgi:hypothetical protein